PASTIAGKHRQPNYVSTHTIIGNILEHTLYVGKSSATRRTNWRDQRNQLHLTRILLESLLQLIRAA
ncbi:MAG TPA: hypothetical protein VN920_05420, partial [Pyrinomonadaceae bacterium]|nr:hypothetical protein [Pyrinomonadaceae bacterium]